MGLEAEVYPYQSGSGSGDVEEYEEIIEDDGSYFEEEVIEEEEIEEEEVVEEEVVEDDDDDGDSDSDGSGDFMDDDSSAPPPSVSSDLPAYDNSLPDDDGAGDMLTRRRADVQLELQNAAVSEGARKAMEEELARTRSIQRRAAKEALHRKRLEQEAAIRRAEASAAAGEENNDNNNNSNNNDESSLQQQQQQQQDIQQQQQKQMEDSARRRLAEEIRKVDKALSNKPEAAAAAAKSRTPGADELQKKKKAIAELRRQAAREELARNNIRLKAAKASRRGSTGGSTSGASAKSLRQASSSSLPMKATLRSPSGSLPEKVDRASILGSGRIKSVDLSKRQDPISPLPWNPNEKSKNVSMPIPLPPPPMTDETPKISGKSPRWRKQPDSRHTASTHTNITMDDAEKSTERPEDDSSSRKNSLASDLEKDTPPPGSANETTGSHNAQEAVEESVITSVERRIKLPQAESAETEEPPTTVQSVTEERRSPEIDPSAPYDELASFSSKSVGTAESVTRTSLTTPMTSPVGEKKKAVDAARLQEAITTTSTRIPSKENDVTKESTTHTETKPKVMLASSPVGKKKVIGGVELPTTFKNISQRRLSIENATSPIASPSNGTKGKFGSSQVNTKNEALNRPTLVSSPEIRRRSKVFEVKKDGIAEIPAAFQNTSKRRLSVENSSSSLGLVERSPVSPKKTNGLVQGKTGDEARSRVPPSPEIQRRSKVFEMKAAESPPVYQNISQRKLSVDSATSPQAEGRPTLLASPEIQRRSKIFEAKKSDDLQLPIAFKSSSQRRLSMENSSSSLASPFSGGKGVVEAATQSPVQSKAKTPLSSPVFKMKTVNAGEIPAAFQNASVSNRKLAVENSPAPPAPYMSPSGSAKKVVESGTRSQTKPKTSVTPMSSPVFRKKVANIADLPTAFQAAAKKTSSVEKATTITATLSVSSAANDGKYYPLADLQQRKVEGIDNSIREQYLAPDEFEKHFKMTKESFSQLPKWKRDRSKRDLKLF